jgi:hypothetical protein
MSSVGAMLQYSPKAHYLLDWRERWGGVRLCAKPSGLWPPLWGSPGLHLVDPVQTAHTRPGIVGGS